MRHFSRILASTLLCVLVLAWAGCADGEDPAAETEVTADTMGTAMDQPLMASVDLSPTEGNTASGNVRFTQEGSTVRVEGTINGLSPGEHGFHVHETGDCSAPDATSAGGHYAPDNAPHGAPTDPMDQRHTGDLGNITAGDDSTATISMVDPKLSLTGPDAIVGKAVVVHANADDLESQPSGNAGPRVACGVIQMSGAM